MLDMTESTHTLQTPIPAALDIGIDGMTCASCVARVERALKKVPGVADAAVNLATESARVQWVGDGAAPADGVEAGTQTPAMPEAASQALPPQILRAIRNAGYTPRAFNDGAADSAPDAFLGIAKDFWPVLLGLLLCAPLVVPMFAMPWLGSERAHALLPIWVQALLGTVVQFTLGLRFYKGAWHAIKQRTGTMDVLVALGTTAAWAMSLWVWARHAGGFDGGGAMHGSHGAPAVYFESAAVVITLVQLGKWLELRARRQTASAIGALQALRPAVAHWLSPHGGEQDVPVAELLAGDVVLLKPGERVPADGTVTQGHSQIDASMLTGEPLPVDVTVGSKVTGGTLNGNGVLHVQVTSPAAEGVLAHIIRLVQDAQAAKPPIQQLVDKVAAVFVPAVLVVAAATLAGWLLAGLAPEQAVLRAVAVLVIACPCALGLATPVAIMAGTGVAARHGILIKNSAVLERAKDIDTVVFDKTGTLTQGRPVLAALWEADGAQQQALALAGALQQGSEHPLAKAVLLAAQEQQADAAPAARALQAVPGRGLQGQIQGRTYALGSLRWMAERQVQIPPDAQDFIDQWGKTGATLSALIEQTSALQTENALQDPSSGQVLLSGDAHMLAVFAFADQLKPESAQAVAQLRALGLRTMLLSGDNRAAAEQVGVAVGLHPERGEVLAEVLPAGKAQAIRRLQGHADDVGDVGADLHSKPHPASTPAARRVVCMVGDGINDAPALAAADTGMAMANPQGGTDVALHAADITLMRGDVRLVAASIDIARRTVRKIRQNLFWAFAYNVVGIPLAAWGLLSPMLAGAAMALSSVSIVANALLLRRWKPQPD